MRMRNKIHDDNHKNDFFLTCRTRAEQFVRENFKELKNIFHFSKKAFEIWSEVLFKGSLRSKERVNLTSFVSALQYE